MNLGHIYDILVVPMVTEKTNQLLSDNKYCFKVFQWDYYLYF